MKMNRLKTLLIFAVGLTLVPWRAAWSASELAPTFTLDGYLSSTGSNTPLLDTGAKLTIQVLDPSKTCLLYEEEQIVNTQVTSGYFNVQVGSHTVPVGTDVSYLKRTAADPGRTMNQIYQNTVPIIASNAPGEVCVGGASYSPQPGDARVFRLIVTPTGGSPDRLQPDTVMDAVPMATVAESVQGYKANQLLILGGGDLTQANLQTVFASGNAAKLGTLLSHDPNNYVLKDAANGTIQIPSASAPAAPVNGQVWYDAGVIKYWNGAEQILTTAGSTSNAVLNGLQPGALNVGTNDNTSLTLSTNANPAITIAANGNIGIGTTSPVSPLQVGAANDGLGLSNGNMIVSSSSSGGIALVKSLTPTSGQAVGHLYFGIGTLSSAQFAARITALATESWSGAGKGSQLEFATTANGDVGPSVKMLLDQNGNVGIGTTTPRAPLETLKGAINSGSTVNASAIITGPHVNFSTRSGTLVLNGNSSAAQDTGASMLFSGRYFDGSDAGLPFAHILAAKEGPTSSGDTSAYLSFGTTKNGDTNTTEKVRITASGNVGIGTTAPTAFLHLKAGTATVGAAPLKFTAGTNLAAVENGVMEFDGTDLFFSSVGVRRTLASTSGGALSGSISSINNASGSITMTPTAGNSIIVNSTTVSNNTTSGALIVNGGAGIAGALNVGGGINSMAVTAATGSANVNSPPLYLSANYWNGSASVTDQWSITNVLGTGTNPTSTLTFDHSTGTSGTKAYSFMNGNFGIGTTNPANLLHLKAVSANMSLESDGSMFSGSNILFASNGTNRWAVRNYSPSYPGLANAFELFQISNASNTLIQTSRLVVNDSGNVGIGTTSPVAKLDIVGGGTSALKIVDGNQGTGKVLTSDANGVAAWASPAAGISGGTANNLVKFTSATTIGSSLITDTGTSISISAANGTTTGGNVSIQSGSTSNPGSSAASLNIRGGNATGGGSGTGGNVWVNGGTSSGSGGGNIFLTPGNGVNAASDGTVNISTPRSATVSNNYGSVPLVFSGTYWQGAWATGDTWSISSVLGSGTSPTSTLTFAHSGSPGSAQYALLNGNVGIGTTGPSYKLDVAGDINASGCLRSSAGIASGTCVSDERLKTDVQSFDLGLEALLGLTPHLLRYNGLGGHPASDSPELGVIAQEVERGAPQLITTKEVKLRPDDGFTTTIKQVNYTAFTYVLINAVKELYHRWADDSQTLHREIASMKAENMKLKEENQGMKERLEKIEKLLEQRTSR